MPLTRDAILAADDITTEEVSVPEWHGTVLVRGMTGRARDAFEAAMQIPTPTGPTETARDYRDLRAKLAARCIVGDDGELLFTEADLEALTLKSGAALERVADVAARLSGLSKNDMKELAENFGETPGGDSSSPSLNGSGAPSENSLAESPATS